MKIKKIILTLYVSIIALSTVGLSFSIAWYSNSTKLKVDAFRLSIDTEDELKISTTAEYSDSKTHLTQADLKTTTLFTPVTTAHSADWIAAKSQTPVFYDDTLGNIDLELKVMQSGYYSQDLYLFSDNDVFVTIDPTSTFMNPNLGYNYSHAQAVWNRVQTSDDPADEYLKGLSVDEIEERLNKIVEAMRFSILVPEIEHYQYAIIDPHKDEDVYLGGLLDNDIDRYYDYEEVNNELVESVQGEINDRSLIAYKDAPIVDTDYENPSREPNAFNAKHKAGVKLFDRETSINVNGLQIAKEKSLSLDEFTNDKRPFAPLLIPVYKNQPNKIVVSIYIEGWDLESVNYTMGATFNAGLQFQIARRMS